MQTPCLFVLLLVVCAHAESQVRETETWVPSDQQDEQLEGMSSGASPNSSDFGFQGEEDMDTFDAEDDDDDDDDDYYEYSGSGDSPATTEDILLTTDIDNRIPDQDPTQRSKKPLDENEIVQKNEVGVLRNEQEEVETNVLMAHASEESIFNKTEVLAALIAGGAVGLLFAILLILLLIYRMKKKDEGSYDLGKKPIYKKAPTTEIYA
ncbi:syndecan-4 isoform X3 [Amia ocellicauda]|uniref:syndecan-4 isoform X3 n=1 Tax=Amia ocellicauda TaxID=2972642 RepID=UPI00346418E7